MQTSSLVKAIAVALLSAIIRPLDRDKTVDTVTLTNVSSRMLTAIAWPRRLQSPLNFTAKVNKIVSRRSSGQNNTVNNVHNSNDPSSREARVSNDKKKGKKDDGLGTLPAFGCLFSAFLPERDYVTCGYLLSQIRLSSVLFEHP